MTNLIQKLESAECGSGLIPRIEALGSMSDNGLDVEIQCALFEPCKRWVSIRPNNAGTKAILTDAFGRETTFWAHDWTVGKNRKATLAALRAKGVE